MCETEIAQKYKVAHDSSAPSGMGSVFLSVVDYLPKSAISGFDLGIVGIAPYICRDALGVEIEDIWRKFENFGELLDHLVLGRVAPVVF